MEDKEKEQQGQPGLRLRLAKGCSRSIALEGQGFTPGPASEVRKVAAVQKKGKVSPRGVGFGRLGGGGPKERWGVEHWGQGTGSESLRRVVEGEREQRAEGTERGGEAAESSG